MQSWRQDDASRSGSRTNLVKIYAPRRDITNARGSLLKEISFPDIVRVLALVRPEPQAPRKEETHDCKKC